MALVSNPSSASVCTKEASLLRALQQWRSAAEITSRRPSIVPLLLPSDGSQDQAQVPTRELHQHRILWHAALTSQVVCLNSPTSPGAQAHSASTPQQYLPIPSTSDDVGLIQGVPLCANARAAAVGIERACHAAIPPVPDPQLAVRVS